MKLIFSTKAITLSAILATAVASAEKRSPNIVFILADDMGIGDISAFNPHSHIKTGNLDNMCNSGLRFTDAHSNSSVSTPTRYGILTGRYAFRTRLQTGTLVGYSAPLIGPDRKTLGTMLKEKGYRTAAIGKWHLGWNWSKDGEGNIDYSKPIADGPTTRGFDYFYGISASLDMPPYIYVENDMPTSLPDRFLEKDKAGLLLQRKGPIGADFTTEDVLPDIGRRGSDYIRAQEGEEKPFFLYLPLTAPHTPILPTGKYKGLSGLSPYGDFVLMVDDIVGNIVATLKETGLYDDTIVIFAADNGCAPYAGTDEMQKAGHYSSGIYRGFKSDLFEGGHRIPLIINWGDRYHGEVDRHLVSLTDFYATFAQMTGYKMSANEGEDSYSLWPILTGKGKYKRHDAIHHSLDGYYAIREGKWKLLLCNGSGGWSHPTVKEAASLKLPAMQLYDLDQDPSEKNNLIYDYPEIAERLEALLDKYYNEGRSTKGRPQKNDTDIPRR